MNCALGRYQVNSSMGRGETRIHLKGSHPGCMFSIIHALHYNRWHDVKKMLPHKRLSSGSRQTSTQDDGKASTEAGEIQEGGDACLIEDKPAERGSVAKGSMRSRIKAKFAEEKSKRKSRHRRSSSSPVETQLVKTKPSPHLESTNSDAELSLKDKSHKCVDKNLSGSCTTESHLKKSNEEPITKNKACELCAAMLSVNYWKQNEVVDQFTQSMKGDTLVQQVVNSDHDSPEPNSARSEEFNERDSLQESKLFIDALDTFGTKKDFFLKILKDPGSPLKNYLNNRQALDSKIGLSKSVSFPVRGSAGRGVSDSSNYTCNLTFPSNAKDEGEFRVCNHSRGSSKTAEIRGEQSVSSLAERRENGNSIRILGRPKSFNNLPPCSPRGLKTEHENTPVIKRFKKLRQKIGHAIRESRKEKKQQVVTDSVFQKIPDDDKSSKIFDETDNLEESGIKKCSRNSHLSSCGSDQSPSALRKQIDIENQRFRRTASLRDSLERYCHLYESTFNKEDKHHVSDGLKLRTEDAPSPDKGSQKFLARILSLPDLRSYSTLQIEDYTGPTATPIRTLVDCNARGERQRLDEQKPPALSLRQESQKQMEAPVDSAGPENFGQYSEALCLGSVDNLTASPENSEPSPCYVVRSDSKEDTSPSKSSITEDSLACQKNELGIDSLANSTDIIQGVQSPVKQPCYDFLHEQVDTKHIAEYNYVKDILQLSGFTKSVSLGTWHFSGQPVDPSLFEEVEACLLTEPDSCENQEFQNCNNLLMFDLINEVLLNIHERSSMYYPTRLTCRSHVSPMPVGHHVLREVWEDISWYLSWRPESYQSLDDAVSQDLAKGDGWMNLQFDAECVGVEIEDMLYDELFDEMTYDDLLEELLYR